MDRLRRLSMLAVMVLCLGTVSPALQAETALPAWFRAGAELRGHGFQDSGAGWTIRIDVTGRVGARIGYGSIPCAGELKLVGVKGDQLIFVETITRNRTNCVSGGTVVLEQIGSSSVSFRWTAEGMTAEGTLAIIDDAVS
jgi:hypothetical protein